MATAGGFSGIMIIMLSRNLLTVVGCATLLASPVFSEASIGLGSSAPPHWRQLQDFFVLKESASGWAGSSGGLETENGFLPLDRTQQFEGFPSLKFNITGKTDWVSVVIVLAQWANHDIHNYVPEGFLEFNVKGKRGGERFLIGADDHVERRASGVERTVKKPITDYCTVTTEWQHVKIPLRDLYGDAKVPLDAANAKALHLDRVDGEPVCLWFNQMKFTSPGKEKGYPAIRVNQVGFRNSTEKYAYVAGFEDELKATTGTPFEVKRVNDDSTAYRGTLVLVKGYDADSGERVLKAVFTDLRESGAYYLTVAVQGVEPSPRFRIGDDVYRSLLADVTRYYYYQRSGIELLETHCPDFPRQDLTPQDSAAVFESRPDKTRDVSKGWFDAGDKGKYVSSGAAAVKTLLWAYETFPKPYDEIEFNLPESGNGVPDVLDEARWELEWLLKMQDEGSGGLWGKVESSPSDGNIQKRVVKDLQDGIANSRPTNDTALAAAAFAQASLVYAPFDRAFSERCLAAARRAWSYLEANPHNVRGSGYTTDSDRDSRFLASASLYRATGEARYHDYFLANYRQSQEVFERLEGDWVGAWNYAFFEYLKASHVEPSAREWFRAEFSIWLKKELKRYETSAWGHTLYPGNYYWGSNNMILGSAAEAYLGSALLGMGSPQIDNLTQAALNYILGANPLRKSYVTGYGEDSLRTVYALFNKDPRPGVPQGFIPLGPNKYNNPGISLFPAKNFMDCPVEWTTNEHSVGSACTLSLIVAFANRPTASSEQSRIPTSPAKD